MHFLCHPQFLWFISVIASAVQVTLIIGAFMTQGTAPVENTRGWVKSPLLRFSASFLTGFGWGGLFGLRQGLPPEGQLVVAAISAITFTILMALLLHFLIER